MDTFILIGTIIQFSITIIMFFCYLNRRTSWALMFFLAFLLMFFRRITALISVHLDSEMVLTIDKVILPTTISVLLLLGTVKLLLVK